MKKEDPRVETGVLFMGHSLQMVVHSTTTPWHPGMSSRKHGSCSTCQVEEQPKSSKVCVLRPG